MNCHKGSVVVGYALTSDKSQTHFKISEYTTQLKAFFYLIASDKDAGLDGNEHDAILRYKIDQVALFVYTRVGGLT